MVERKSRFTLLHKLEQKTAQATSRSIVDHLLPLPPHIRRTITYDNGSENTEHETANRKLGTQSYFCNPYHSWEKATVENTIGLVRRFFPKKTNFAHLDPAHIKLVQFLLNKRPRKCLNYLTPAEVLLDECCT
jgi:IS30 family transposase